MSDLPDPSAVAEGLLHDARVSGPPVSLEAVVQLWPGVRIVLDDLQSEGYVVDLGAQGAEILVRARDPESRRRYTIAHEIGHLTIARACGGVPPRSTEIERWCDTFAAALLMPASWVRQDLQRARQAGVTDAILGKPQAYGVSGGAFRLRVSEVSRVSVYEIATEVGKARVLRQYASRQVPVVLLAKTLRQILLQDFPTCGHEARRAHDETGFVSVQRLIEKKSQGRCRWLVCAWPASRNGGSHGEPPRHHHESKSVG